MRIKNYLIWCTVAQQRSKNRNSNLDFITLSLYLSRTSSALSWIDAKGSIQNDIDKEPLSAELELKNDMLRTNISWTRQWNSKFSLL
jgi:hypothetical protein